MNGAWGRLRSPMAVRLPRVCRSAQDDLSGTFKNVIGAILAAAMRRAVVCASSSRVQQLASRGLLGSVSTENFDCVSCQLEKQSRIRLEPMLMG